MPQPVFKAGEQCLLVAGLDKNDPPWGKAGLRESWGEQVLTRHAPKDLALRSCRDAGREQSCCRAVHRAVAATGHLMKRTKGQAAAGKSLVDLSYSEWKHLLRPHSATFNALDALSKFGEDRRGVRVRHGDMDRPIFRKQHVSFICSCSVP